MKNTVIFHSTDICEFCEKGNCRRREELGNSMLKELPKNPTNQPTKGLDPQLRPRELHCLLTTPDYLCYQCPKKLPSVPLHADPFQIHEQGKVFSGPTTQHSKAQQQGALLHLPQHFQAVPRVPSSEKAGRKKHGRRAGSLPISSNTSGNGKTTGACTWLRHAGTARQTSGKVPRKSPCKTVT